MSLRWHVGEIAGGARCGGGRQRHIFQWRCQGHVCRVGRRLPMFPQGARRPIGTSEAEVSPLLSLAGRSPEVTCLSEQRAAARISTCHTQTSHTLVRASGQSTCGGQDWPVRIVVSCLLRFYLKISIFHSFFGEYYNTTYPLWILTWVTC